MQKARTNIEILKEITLLMDEKRNLNRNIYFYSAQSDVGLCNTLILIKRLLSEKLKRLHIEYHSAEAKRLAALRQLPETFTEKVYKYSKNEERAVVLFLEKE